VRGWTVEAVLERLRQRRSDTPAVVIVDALDEASLDTELLRTVLLRLALQGADDGRPPVCKVVIGVRPWWDRFPELGPRSSHATDRIDLDRTPAEEHETDLRNYLADLLEEAPGYIGHHTAGLRDDVAKAVARRLSAVPHGGGFLLASVFAHYLSEYDTPLEADEAVRRVPDDLPGMLDLHLGVLAKDRPAIHAVLRALAHGRGEGMPLEIIRAVAQAFTAPGETAPDLADTKQAIEAAAFYVRTAKDTDGRRLYRFFHQSLSDHLAPASSDHGALLDALLDTIPGNDERGDPAWDLALPYVLRHTAEHAVAAGRLDELLKSPAFLVHASPTELRAQLPHARSLRARNTARVIESALAPQNDPWVRWEWLRNSAVGADEKWLEHGLDALRSPDSRSPDPLVLEWGSQSRETQSALSHPDRAVFVPSAAGPVVVTAHAGGGVQVWDTRTGGLVDDLAVHGQEVTALSAGASDDALLVAVGTADGDLTVYHLDTRRIAWTDSLPARVTAIAFGTLRGAPVVAVCAPQELYLYTRSGERLWQVDLLWTWFEASGGDEEHPYGLQMQHAATADVVALAELDGTPTVIVGTSVGTVELWDADGGNHRSRRVHAAPVRTLLPSRNGTDRTVVTCADDGVRVLNMDAGTVADVPDSAGVDQVAALLDINGEEHLAIGRAERVEIRSLRSPALSGDPVRSHDRPAGTSLRALAGDGARLLAVAESKYHGVIVLNRIDSAERLAPWEGHDDEVACVAMTGHRGRQFALSLDASGALHTWDTEDGLCLSTGHYPYAESATAGVVGNQPVAFVGDISGTVRAVDMTDGTVRRTWRWPVRPRHLYWTGLGGKPLLAVRDFAGRLFLADAERPEDLRPVDVGQPLPVLTGTDLSGLGTEDLGPPETPDFLAALAFPETAGPPEEQEVIAAHYGLHEEQPVLVRGFESGWVTGHLGAERRPAFSFDATDLPLERLHVTQSGRRLRVVTASYDGTIRAWAPFDRPEPLGQVQVPGGTGPLAVSPSGMLAASGSRISYFSWASTGEETR
jgi:WD40 repeat protein